ncbi:hypothetical protein H632_c602p0, partial [Helicosporidium sp. ATCC 50920]
QALDLALEDVLYALDRLLNSGALDPEPYLKTGPAPAAEASPQQGPGYAASVQLPVGDAWYGSGMLSNPLVADEGRPLASALRLAEDGRKKGGGGGDRAA